MISGVSETSCLGSLCDAHKTKKRANNKVYELNQQASKCVETLALLYANFERLCAEKKLRTSLTGTSTSPENAASDNQSRCIRVTETHARIEEDLDEGLREREKFVGCVHTRNTHAHFAQNLRMQTQHKRNLKRTKKQMQKNYKFCKSLHRFFRRPSLLVVFVRNHGVPSSMRAGQESDCIVLTFCTICCLRFRWRSHQSVNLYFAASSSLRQVDLCINSTEVSLGRRLTPTMSLSILLLLVRRSLSVSTHIVQNDDP